MKKKLIILILLINSYSFSQDVKSEYISLKVQYGLKMIGMTNNVFLDIGSSGQHSLSGTINNDDGIVTIEGREYVSAVDILNYLGKLGWSIYETREMKILNEGYYEYLLVKETTD